MSKQGGEENLAIFIGWIATKSDDDFRQMVHRGALSRKEIARECGFGKSALTQNPDIKEALKSLEDGLRDRDVLPPIAEPSLESPDLPMREPGHQRSVRDADALRRLQMENASQKAEIAELKRRLSKYESLHEALVSTGRVPR